MKQLENFGKTAKDKVTGYEGIITGVAFYMYGCAQYMVVPKSKDGKRGEAEWFDEGRLAIGKLVVKPSSVRVEKNGCEKRETPKRK